MSPENAPVTDPADTSATPTGNDSRWRVFTANDYRVTKLVATVTGLLGLILAIATPLLPVQQRSTTLDWPQHQVVSNVTAPLVAFVPTSMTASVPCSLAKDLPASGGVLMSTVPAAGKQATARGLFVRATDSQINMTVRDVLLLSVDRQAAQANPNCSFELKGGADGVVAQVKGMSGDGTHYQTADTDMRPQIVGVFSDLVSPDAARTTAAPAGLALHADVDTRFVNSPTPLKRAAIILGILMTLLSLIALAVLDLRDGRGHKRFLPRGWFTIRAPDVVVTVVLALWWLIGGNTSDDGYNITVARITKEAGYADNYFRYFGVPQDPFGWPYQVLSWMTQVSVATPWLRLPALLMGLLGWWLLSREVIPRLGRAVRTNQAAIWSSALVFLAIWMPYNNGIRFEGIEAIGALLTWCAVERSIATRRLLPYAVAAIVGAFTLAVAPGGLMAVAALLAGLRPVVRGIVSRRTRDGLLPLLAPLLAAGTAVLFAIFYWQPLMPLIEGSTVASDVGPTLEWWQEPVRYYYLILQTGDGTFSRRFGILVMFLCLIVVIFRLLSKSRLNGVARAPIWRLVAIMLGTMFFISFTPTKWTHHLGIYAGIGAAIVAATAAMMSPALLRSRSNRAFFTAAVLLVTAVSATGTNMWWYVGSYGVPWWDRPISVAGIKLGWVVLALALIATLVGLWYYFRNDYVDEEKRTGYQRTGLNRFKVSPLPVIAALVVLFMMASFAKGAWTQRDSWSWAKSNARALAGNECGLANDVLVESDVNASILRPAATGGKPAPSPTAALAGTNDGFTPSGVPSDVYIDPLEQKSSSDTTDDDTATTILPTTEEVTGEDADHTDQTQSAPATVVRLPYGLNPATTPVLGSYGATGTASVTTDWYQLPFAAGKAPEQSPLLAVAAAGSVQAIDPLGAVIPGRKLVAEYARTGPDGRVVPVGHPQMPIDAMALNPSSTWRTLRFPLKQAPPGATMVRLNVVDDAAASAEWVAFTPPRVPALRTLNDVVGRTVPVFIDWLPGLVFPCQRPMAVRDGVLELPQWRIMPDADATQKNSQSWQAGKSGGPLGITDALLSNTLVPTYLRNNWGRDWGGLERFTPLVPNAKPADLELGYRTVNGLWSPAPMRSAGY
ncbi:arabinosyltransferase domain-containing protein [Gordonia sp. (in: high G+C Gram-positive bacteria)]|uniref:arabinosyltransferase domain-containing protein n=1 Tax=Gordonia sp. (in: high G+C Gram-positive bacteria) TaxID=84139 RepID=UPI0026176720|nr:arabinosyltransferase domain-containing protein [Gordonia sp. (in: high G+C Gram-positive bacteria)]